MQAGLAFKGQGVYHSDYLFGSVQSTEGDKAIVLFAGATTTFKREVALTSLRTAAILPEDANPIVRLEYSKAKGCTVAIRERVEEEEAVYA